MLDFCLLIALSLLQLNCFFNILKQKIRANYSEEMIDFDEDSGVNWLLNSLNTIWKPQIKGVWLAFVRHAELCVIKNF